jgi:DNA polymerase alpha subunit B
VFLALETTLEELGSSMIEQNSLENPSIIHIPIQEQMIAVGRVCAEVDGKLGDVSGMKYIYITCSYPLLLVVLESSNNDGKARVRMFLKNAEEYSIFPGQIIAVEAVNPTGKLLMVSKVHEPSPLPFYTPDNQEEAKLLKDPLSIAIASGPWTASDNLNFDPLHSLLDDISADSENAPDLLILVSIFFFFYSYLLFSDWSFC